MTIMTKEQVGAWCKEIADKINADPVLLEIFERAYSNPANELPEQKEQSNGRVIMRKDGAFNPHD
jgi:translation initiation factor 2 beta subunit (eIF-2beta)/eIF-5